jgi:broad specificity phosphatase PhoE
MAAMSARAVAAVRSWDARIAAEHGPEAIWVACSHGDVIKAIVADAMGLHLDEFQRIVADPASVTAIRYTATRPFLVRLNDTGDLSGLVPPPNEAASSDGAVGGGPGPDATGDS